MQYILDTYHLRLLEYSEPSISQHLREIDPKDIAITVITVEEKIQVWFSAIRRASQINQPERLCQAYLGLRSAVQYLDRFQMLDFDEFAFQQFVELRCQSIRIGTQDCSYSAQFSWARPEIFSKCFVLAVISR